MSTSTLTNLTQHPADRTPVDVDVTIALDICRNVWLGAGGEDRDPAAGAHMLRHEDDFLTAIHGPDYHLLPKVAAVLEVKPS